MHMHHTQFTFPSRASIITTWWLTYALFIAFAVTVDHRHNEPATATTSLSHRYEHELKSIHHMKQTRMKSFPTLKKKLKSLFKLQSDWLERAKKALKNFAKDDTARKTTRAYYTTRLESFGGTVSVSEKNHRQLVTLVSMNDRITLPYFNDDLLTSNAIWKVKLRFITALQSECEEKFKEDGSMPEPKAEPSTF